MVVSDDFPNGLSNKQLIYLSIFFFFFERRNGSSCQIKGLGGKELEDWRYLPDRDMCKSYGSGCKMSLLYNMLSPIREHALQERY